LHPSASRAIDIIVPFYKRADLVAPLFASIHRLSRELQPLQCSIVAINDSPDDLDLHKALAAAANRTTEVLPCMILANATNGGFVRSANRGLRQALERGHDAILLNSDTVLFDDAVHEMQRVAYLDPAIGFVCPRSNNATLCSFPHQPEYNGLPAEESFARFRLLARYLPDRHYIPTGVGFCLYIKFSVLQEVGLLDEIYSPGYNEENDLVMRARRCGWRVSIANHAYVYHSGSASFSSTDLPKGEIHKRNLTTLAKRYPFYWKHVDEYYQSVHLQAELLLPVLLTDCAGRWDLLLDLSALNPSNNQDAAAVKDLAMRLVDQWRPWFNIFAAGSSESIAFHSLREMPGVSIVELDAPRIFALAVRFGLPSQYQDAIALSKRAVCNVYAVLDPVGSAAESNESKLTEELWSFVSRHADGLIYESRIARDRFREAYDRHPAMREFVANGLDEEGAGEFLKATVEHASFESILTPRLRAIRLLEERLTLDSAREQAETELQQLQRENRQHLSECEAARRVESELRAEAGNLGAAIQAARIEIAGLRRSWSWRLTAPVRSAGRLVLSRFRGSPR
jgi:GT2 family glycosyltransferase